MFGCYGVSHLPFGAVRIYGRPDHLRRSWPCSGKDSAWHSALVEKSCQNAQFGSSREHLIRMERGRIDLEESALPELSPYRHQSRCLPQGNVPGRCLPSTCRSAGIRHPMDKAFLPDPARCKLPLCFIGQTLARPLGVRQSVCVHCALVCWFPLMRFYRLQVERAGSTRPIPVCSLQVERQSNDQAAGGGVVHKG